MAVIILHVGKYGKKKKVTRKFKSGGLHERHVVATWEPSQNSLVDTGKPRKLTRRKGRVNNTTKCI